ATGPEGTRGRHAATGETGQAIADAPTPSQAPTRRFAESDQGWGVIGSPSVRCEAIKVKSESRAARVAPESPDHTGLPRGFPLWLADVEAGACATSMMLEGSTSTTSGPPSVYSARDSVRASWTRRCVHRERRGGGFAAKISSRMHMPARI